MLKVFAGILAISLGAGCAPASFRPAEGAAAPAAGVSPSQPPPGGPARPAAPPGGIGGALDRATNWLITKQNPDGGYGSSIADPKSSDVGITAFILYALARCPRQYKEHDGPYVSKAVAFLTSRQQEDGAIYDPRDPSLQNYKTSVAILAFLALDRVKYADPVLKKAVAFVKAQQFAEAQGYVASEHAGFGGIGYGGDRGRPDLSNSQFAAEALHEAGISGADDLWVRLQTFVGRCQNLETVDEVVKKAGVGSTKDGGFRYAPTQTRGNTETIDGEKVFSSYGSMTYAGLKSFLYAQVDKKDPRVQAAFNWIRSHFTVTENPGMATTTEPGKGQQGLYYYYHTMAKALAAYGESVLVDDRGRKHVWAKELSDQLISLQKPEGYWDNPAERWMEGLEILDTAYAVVALTVCQEELKKFEQAGGLKDVPPSRGTAPEKSTAPEKPKGAGAQGGAVK